MTARFDELFRSEYPALVALAVTSSTHPTVAHELAQEALLRAHRDWDRLATYDNPSAWLRRVMTNLVIDHHRHRRVERAATPRVRAAAEAAQVQQDGELDPGISIDSPRWEDLIEPLSPRQRMIATLYYAEDRSVGEIADVVGISTGTVKSTLSKVRRTLRRTLDNDTQRGTDR